MGKVKTKQYSMVFKLFIVMIIFSSIYILRVNQNAIVTTETTDSRQNIELELMMNGENKTNTKICDYMQVKGLPKSGTTWLKHILSVIKKKICRHNSNMYVCNMNVNHIIAHPRHVKSTINSDIINELTNSTPRSDGGHLYFMGKQLLNEYKSSSINIRWCVFVIFRDLRDRLKSLSYHRRIGDNERNEFVTQRIDKQILWTIDWWNFFKTLNQTTNHQYCVLFYEDLLLNQYKTINKILNFIGISNLLTIEEINWILKLISKNAPKSKSKTLLREGINCAFHTELDRTTINLMNSAMIQKLPHDLLKKFNQTCSVDII